MQQKVELGNRVEKRLHLYSNRANCNIWEKVATQTQSKEENTTIFTCNFFSTYRRTHNFCVGCPLITCNLISRKVQCSFIKFHIIIISMSRRLKFAKTTIIIVHGRKLGFTSWWAVTMSTNGFTSCSKGAAGLVDS